MIRSGVSAAALALSAALVLPACSTRRSLNVDWAEGERVSYRLLTKDDFQAATSSSLWGNVAHGAEICTHILPADDFETSGAFLAVMKPECSFWNKVGGSVSFMGRLLAIATGVPIPVYRSQPELYILQHEQIHFAIMQVAALTLTEKLGALPPERRTLPLVERVYAIALEQVRKRHHEFDSETSGIYDPTNLEKWIRVLEAQMRDLCGAGRDCRIRVNRNL